MEIPDRYIHVQSRSRDARVICCIYIDEMLNYLSNIINIILVVFLFSFFAKFEHVLDCWVVVSFKYRSLRMNYIFKQFTITDLQSMAEVLLIFSNRSCSKSEIY